MGAGALIIGTGLQAFGAYQSGKSKKSAALLEARGKEAQAAQVDLYAKREVDLTERRYEKTKSAQISAFSRSGVELSGSPLLQLEESAANAFDEIQSIKDAASYRKSTLQTEAALSRYLGNEAEMAGMLSGASSILTGISKNPYSYDKPKRKEYITLGTE